MQASSNFSTRTWSDLGYINNIPNRIVDRSHFNTKMQNNIHCINFVKHTSNISNILERNFMTFKQFSRTISRYSTGGGSQAHYNATFITFSSSLSPVQCSLLLTVDRATWGRNKRSAGRNESCNRRNLEVSLWAQRKAKNMRSDLIALNEGTSQKLNLHKRVFLTLTASKMRRKYATKNI